MNKQRVTSAKPPRNTGAKHSGEGGNKCRLGDLFENRRERGRAGLPLLSVTLTSGLVNREDQDRKQDSALTPEEHLLVRRGDIAYNTMRMWQGAFGLAATEGLVSPAYVVLKPKLKTDAEYVAHLLRSQRLLHLLWAYSYGITDDRLRLYFEDFASIPVFIPESGTQRQIAQLLSTLDQLIDIAERLASSYESEKNSLMRRILSPVKSQWKEGGWRRVSLGEVAKIDQSTLSAKTPADYRFRYISLSDISEGRISDYLEEHVYSDAPSRARRLVRAGDVLMATVRPSLKSYALVDQQHNGCVASTGFAVFSCSEELLPEFLYHYLFSDDVQRQVNALVAGSNYPAIASSDVSELLINMPDLKTQSLISKLLSSINENVKANRRYRDVLKREKQGLAQRLLSQKVMG